jgi:hypothetical protein
MIPSKWKQQNEDGERGEILLTPGIVTNSPQQSGSAGQSGEFSVNGQRTEENNYMVDGVSANVGSAAGMSKLDPRTCNTSFTPGTFDSELDFSNLEMH